MINTIISLDKVIAAKLTYLNQHSIVMQHKPTTPTANGDIISDGFALPHTDYPLETALERARRLDVIDKWTPHLYVQLQGGVKMIFNGPRALSIWEAYKAREFNKSKSQHKDTTNDIRRSKGKATKD